MDIVLDLVANYLPLVWEFAVLIFGLYLLILGSNYVTDSAVPVSQFLNTTYVAVGLVLVSLLLSLPEVLVALFSLSKNHQATGIGVSIGSIIVNIGLIIGITALIKPIKVPKHVISRDAVFMVIATLVVYLVLLDDGRLNQYDGAVFILIFLYYLINVFEQEKTLAFNQRKKQTKMITKTLQIVGRIGNAELIIKDSWLIFLIGMVLMLIGTELFTNGLINTAKLFGFSELIIGLSLGALGTSVPNLAAALAAAKKGYDELAISETIGSNTFTLLVTLGIIGIVQPLVLEKSVIEITLNALVLVTGVFFFFALQGKITRWQGLVLIILYLITMYFEFKDKLGI